MIILAGFVFGVLLGALRARARGGKGFDLAQWAGVHGIVFALVGLFVTVLIDRMN